LVVDILIAFGPVNQWQNEQSARDTCSVGSNELFSGT
jgi:hypothetical protein